MTDAQKKKPTAGFWITVVVVVVLAYPLSFGPACWLATRWRPLRGPVNSIYSSAAWACFKAPNAVGNAIIWYANVAGDVNFSGTEHGGFRLTFAEGEYDFTGDLDNGGAFPPPAPE
jgi:hypothetical protein